ncbi:hypothetical protein [Marinigracilibium pacificum]|uniref:Uncharacterized protein n=1 Tax=Marinigracilibium pacificum TaxID=2729599 RepID=A0A848J5X5_9BACT|nr:hypothetical protein [Marinigracilibium pacificum]NMM48532.1 hypothetical protein [Marinigracilibium pacificum]
MNKILYYIFLVLLIVSVNPALAQIEVDVPLNTTERAVFQAYKDAKTYYEMASKYNRELKQLHKQYEKDSARVLKDVCKKYGACDKIGIDRLLKSQDFIKDSIDVNELARLVGKSNELNQLQIYTDSLHAISEYQLDSLKPIIRKELAKVAEEQAKEFVKKQEFGDQFSQLEQTLGSGEWLDFFQQQMSAVEGLPQNANSQAQNAVKTPVQNVFADNQAVLEQAQAKLAKAKRFYSEVQDINDLPKNPLGNKPLKERLNYGGSLTITGRDQIAIDAAPFISYLIYPRWSSGLSVVARMTVWTRDSYVPSKVSNNMIGGRLFTEYEFVNNIGGYAEYEQVYRELEIHGTDKTAKKWIPGVYVGAYKELNLTKKITIKTYFLYNLTYDEFGSSVPNPFNVRVTFQNKR